MIKLILLASLISLPVFAQENPLSDLVPKPEGERGEEMVPETEPESIESAAPEALPEVATEPAPEETEKKREIILEDPKEAAEKAAATDTSGNSPVMTTEVPKEKRNFNPLESHWVTSYGFEGMKYDTDFNFDGEEKSFSPGEIELWGGRIGLGGEIYLGAGFLTTSKVEGYYNGTLFNRVLNAGPEDDDVEFAYSKITGQVYGIDISQSIGYIFDMKTYNPLGEWTYLTIEPYVEVGVGRAWSYTKVNYNYNTGATTNEGYKKRSEDELVNARFGGGINFTANTGFFFYIKAHVNSFDITKRESEEYKRPDQAPTGTTTSTESTDAKIDPKTTYAIGGGYKF